MAENNLFLICFKIIGLSLVIQSIDSFNTDRQIFPPTRFLDQNSQRTDKDLITKVTTVGGQASLITDEQMSSLERAFYYSNQSLYDYCKTTKIAMLSSTWLSPCPKKARDMAAAKYGTTDQIADIHDFARKINVLVNLVKKVLPPARSQHIKEDLYQIQRHLNTSILDPIVKATSITIDDGNKMSTVLTLLGQINNLLGRSLRRYVRH